MNYSSDKYAIEISGTLASKWVPLELARKLEHEIRMQVLKGNVDMEIANLIRDLNAGPFEDN